MLHKKILAFLTSKSQSLINGTMKNLTFLF